LQEEGQKPMKAPPPMMPTNIFSPTEKKSMDFPEPEKPKKEATPPPEPVRGCRPRRASEPFRSLGRQFGQIRPMRGDKRLRVPEVRSVQGDRRWSPAVRSLDEAPAEKGRTMPPRPNIASQLTALQYNVGSLYSLLGGTPDERERFFEIHKGITTPAVFEQLVKELSEVNDQISQTQVSLQAALKSVAVEAQVG
jgi:hypothetical protein